MVENVRFFEGETKNSTELAERYAQLADVYVNDAFGAAHRAHASTEAVAHLLPSAAGRLLEREVKTLTGILEDPKRPLVAVVGGAKVTDKIGVLEAFLRARGHGPDRRRDVLPVLQGGQGHDVGRSLCEEEGIEPARAGDGQREARAADRPRRRPRVQAPTPRSRTLDGIDVPDGWMGLDVGPKTTERYSEDDRRAPARCSGTARWARSSSSRSPRARRRVAEAMAATEATTVIGGGDSAAALKQFGLTDQVTHLSTGGGASLELIEGKELPGVKALS